MEQVTKLYDKQYWEDLAQLEQRERAQRVSWSPRQAEELEEDLYYNHYREDDPREDR